VASVLTPYKPSDGNNPYTEAQLKALWADLEPSAREPGKYSPAERVLLQRTFLTFIAEGYSATRACTKIQLLAKQDPSKWPYAEYATFMAWKAYDKDFAEAYEVAYSMGTDNLEDKGVEMAYGGNASMLQFLLRMRNPQRYNPRQEVTGPGGGAIEHVHTIKLIAAKAKPLEIEHDDGEARVPVDVTDAEVVSDGR
jgi:hypothetical protein